MFSTIATSVSTIERLEEFLQFFSRNAYIIVALDGKPFMDSGEKAFQLFAKNLTNIVVLNSFGDFVLFLGRLFGAAISGFVCYELVSVSFLIHSSFS